MSEVASAARPLQTGSARWPARAKRWAINAFIVVFLAATVSASMPAPAQRAPLRYVRSVLRPVLLRCGLWQSWDMFANPPSTLDTVEADVRLADGTSVTWVFPRMETLGYAQRYRQERFRKFRERVRMDAYRVAREDVARFIARRVSRPGNAAREVSLIHRWAPIPAPVGPSLPPRSSRSTFTNASPFFEYAVQPEDLS